jgi:hypothetical protein
MGFTIEVKKKAKDEDFDFGSLEMSHQECYGGRIKAELEPDQKSPEYTSSVLFGEPGNRTTFAPSLRCKRCGAEVRLSYDPEQSTTQIVKTAIDGQQRKIKSLSPPGEITVVRGTD